MSLSVVKPVVAPAGALQVRPARQGSVAKAAMFWAPEVRYSDL